MARIVVTRKIPEAGLALLRQANHDVWVDSNDRPLTRAELLDVVERADSVLCLLTDKIDAEVFDRATHCRGFANYAVGFDNMDIAEATRRKVPLSNTPGVLTDATFLTSMRFAR